MGTYHRILLTFHLNKFTLYFNSNKLESAPGLKPHEAINIVRFYGPAGTYWVQVKECGYKSQDC